MTNKTDSESTSVNGHDLGSPFPDVTAGSRDARTQSDDQERRVKRWGSRSSPR